MELGNLSDWFNTAGTLGTFAVAYAAYRKAPEWIKQKQSENGYNHVVSMIALYDQHVLYLQALHVDIKRLKKPSHNFQLITIKVEEQIFRTFDLSARLSACKRWNISYSPVVKEAFKRVEDYYEKAVKVLVSCGTTIRDNSDPLIKELTDIEERIESDATIFMTSIEKLFTFPK